MKLLNKNLFICIVLCAIFIFALFIRVYNLNSIPLGFHIDEASLGYNGYSLLITGKDENNNKLPLYIDMFGDNRPSGYHYLTILPIKFIGLNEFSVRFPGALFGALSVIPFFFLAQLIFKNKKVSLLSSFLVAIAPWTVVSSRASAEGIVALFFIITGYVFFISGFQNRKSIYIFAGTIIMALSFFFYHTPRIFVPILILTSLAYLFPIWRKFKNYHRISILVAFLTLCVISFSLIFLIKGGTGRFSQVNIFGFPQVKLVMQEQIREDGLIGIPATVTRIFHNKIINYSLGFLTNYSEYFSGKFLFLEGGFPWWYRIPGIGLIYLVELPFILAGIYYVLSSKDRSHKLSLIWLVLAPVTAAFTIDDIPNVQRSMIMFPVLDLITAFGFITFAAKFSGIKYKAFVFIFSLLLLMNISYFMHQYFVHAQVHRNWYRNEGFDKVMSIIKKDYSNVDKIVISKTFGGVYPLILFYMKYDPVAYQKEGSTKDKTDTGFGKFFFVDALCPSIDKDSKVPKVRNIIYIDQGDCKEYPLLKYVKHIYVDRKEGTKAYRIVYN